MNDADAVDLCDTLRKRWPEPFDNHPEWRHELELVAYHPARQALTELADNTKRPTIAQFRSVLRNQTPALTPEQIAINVAGINRLRDTWNNRIHPHQQPAKNPPPPPIAQDTCTAPPP